MKIFHGMALVMGLSIAACGSDDSGGDGPAAADSGTGGTDRDAGDPSDADAGTNADAGNSQTGPGAFTLDYASSDDFFTLMDGQVKGASPHGTVQIWYSSNIMSIIDDASFEVPEGTTSIKEFDMDSDGTLDGFAVMIKREAGYDPESNDWYYEMRDPAGEVMAEPAPGKIEMCINCHAGWAQTDYLAGISLQ